ncbi:MAG TPA: enoyl-CoA hydratase [Flavobacteriales bacterium]|nr:enoyl-CoA hydratase [Flavobacteriales bacterium]
MDSNVIIQKEGSIALLTINRPDQLNALNVKTINDLSIAFKELEADKEVKVIILTGAGDRAFVAGADIKEFYQFSVEEGKKLSKDGHEKLFNLVENLNTFVIAAVNGFALGGGLELAMSCHIRVASHNAKMGLPEVGLGVIPGYGGTQRLAQLVGKGRAIELIATAEMINSETAKDWGLVNHVTTQAELIDRCREIARRISQNSSVAIAGAVRAIIAGFQSGVNGFEMEIEEFGKCFGTQDFKEGTSAFVEKRKPNFPGA